MEDVGMARILWNKFKKVGVVVMYTPYVVCLASGKMNTDSFRNCTSQDGYFLKAFVNAFEKAEDYSYDDEDKVEIRKMRNFMVQALELGNNDHGDSACSWTTKYTNFLRSVGAGKIGDKFPGKFVTPFQKSKLAAYLVGAVASYMRFHVFLTKELHPLLDPDIDTVYKNWIDNYCSWKFEASTLQTEDLLDKLSVALTVEELDDLEKIYQQATKLEVEFFSTQPLVQQTVVPLFPVRDHAKRHLSMFCDFDMACSPIDSSALLAEIAIVTAPPKIDLNLSQSQPDLHASSQAQLPPVSSVHLKRKWQVLSNLYTEELEKSMKDIVTSEKGWYGFEMDHNAEEIFSQALSSSFAAEKFDYAGLCEALEKLSDFEKRANSRVVQSGVLKGLKVEDIKRAGLGLKLQDGCRNFFQKILKRVDLKADANVISYCWCGDFIKSAFASEELDGITIHSNELVFENSTSTGEIIKKFESPREKLQALREILARTSKDDGSEQLTVYIGGSVGDFLCLLEADIGIVKGSSPSLRRLGHHFGVSFLPLFSGLVKKQQQLVEGGSSEWKGMSGILYTVSCWAEIHAFFLGDYESLFLLENNSKRKILR